MINWKRPTEELPDDVSKVMIAIKKEGKVEISYATYSKYCSAANGGKASYGFFVTKYEDGIPNVYVYSDDEVGQWCYSDDFIRMMPNKEEL